MQLGDSIKKVTSVVGIKPCTGCEKRAEKLNEWSRRGFVCNMALAGAFTKNLALKGAWKLFGVEPPVGVS